MIYRKIILVLLLVVFFVTPNLSYAQTTNQAAVDVLIAELTKKIEFLQMIILERQSFFGTGAVPKTPDDPDYFTFKDISESYKVFGSDATNLVFRADGSVDQVLILTDCSDIDGTLKINDHTCADFNWVSEFDESDGIRTFRVPFELSTNVEKESVEVSFYACRFNGCQKEIEVELLYKEEVTFGDQVNIYDRHEWTYEWKDNIHHVQEVLLYFPTDNIKKVKLDIDCEGQGLYIRTDEEDRATCNSKRDYSQVDFGDVEVDELGNIYNLRVESVTDDIQVEEAGFVTMKFSFVNWQNRIVYEAEHVPSQLEESLE